jgi:hypothetical protein
VAISNLTYPTSVGVLDTPSEAFGVVLEGDYAYIADYTAGFRVLNITDPTNPTFAGVYDTPGAATDVVVAGDYAYVADGVSGLRVVNITDPTNPTSVGVYDTPGTAFGVVVAGNYAYVADGASGLRVVNITDPTNPTSAGVYDTPGAAFDVVVAGDYAYVADGPQGLRVVDITDPTNPTSAGVYDTPDTAEDVIVAGDYAYVADWSTGLRVVDITDPTNPTFAGVYDTPGFAEGVVVVGDFVYIADYTAGLRVVNITDPTNPTSAGVYDTPGNAMAVFVAGDFAYVADRTEGLRVIEVRWHRWRQYPGLAVAQSTSFYSGSATVIKATLTATHTTPTDTTIAYSLSADNGANWETVSSGIEHPFTNTGKQLKWKAVLSSTNFTVTPQLYDLSITYTTRLDAPSLASPSDGANTNDNTPDFSWSSVTGAATYLLQLDTVSSFDSINLQNNSPVSSPYTPMSPLADGTWYWRVGAVDSDNDVGFLSGYRSLNIETIDPTWDELPSDQVIEFCTGFSYNVNASDASGIASYWVNDSVTFSIDSTGVITNSTALPVGVYWLEVRAYDPYTNYCTATFKVTVEDTTDPTWDELPSDQVIEFCSGLSYDVNASDHSGITSYWINDTGTFSIDITGVITNSTALPVGVYWLEVRAYDPYANYCTATFKVTVEDTTDPTWDESLTNQVVEYCTGFSYDVNASDHSGITSYWINDTGTFSIDITGVITNSTALPVGVYWLEIRAYDPYTNYCTATIQVTVHDTTAPTWVISPTDQTLSYGASLDYQVTAWDHSGIAQWAVNDTVHFTIDVTGRITSVGTLNADTYGLAVTVADAYGNTQFAVFTVTVTPVTTPSLFPIFVVGGVIAVAVVVVGLVLYLRYQRKP